MWYRFCKDLELEEDNIPKVSWEDLEQKAKLRSEKQIFENSKQEIYGQLVEKDLAFLNQIWEKYQYDPKRGLEVLVRNLKNQIYYKPFGPDLKGDYKTHKDMYDKHICTDIGTKEAYEVIDAFRTLIPADLEEEAKKPQIDSKFEMPPDQSRYWNKPPKYAEFSDFKNIIYLTILQTPLPKIPQEYNNIRELDRAKIDKLEYEVIDIYKYRLFDSLRFIKNKIYNFLDREYHEQWDNNEGIQTYTMQNRKLEAVKVAYRELIDSLFAEGYYFYKAYFNLTTTAGIKEFNKFMAENISDKFVELMEHHFDVLR